MYRFFSDSKDIFQDKIVIVDKKEVHHLKDVLRVKLDEQVVIFDEKANEYICRIQEILKDKVMLRIENRITCYSGLSPYICVACAMPKKARMDEVVDKLTQLGVERIIPLMTQRVIVKPDEKGKILKQRRWERIALVAAQQSQRSTVPQIGPIMDIKEVLRQCEDYDLRLIPTLTGQRRNLRQIMFEVKPKRILVLIGPEGDFTEEELNLAESKGFMRISLGNLVLRVETACVAIVSFIRFLFL
ncbi:MAG: 16S rRNA (uracil(1498)-N(3))-methyltransferase [Candidatus Omnitrophica bacterium]|nr:16S rRNA (uracil(1498)-N(3))-methyltransferase [Candidatus Omnitrophota bacterium]